MTRSLANVVALKNPNERLLAAGRLLPGEALPNDGIAQTGGMIVDRDVPISEQVDLIRFSRRFRDGKLLTPSDHLSSSWWLTLDLFKWLESRAMETSRSLQQVVREQLLLPPEWSDADCFARAYPKSGIELGGWFGRPLGVAPQGGMSGWTMAPEAPESWMYQIYIPGLAMRGPLAPVNRNNASRWLEFEGLYELNLKVIGRSQPFHPRLVSGKFRR